MCISRCIYLPLPIPAGPCLHSHQHLRAYPETIHKLQIVLLFHYFTQLRHNKSALSCRVCRLDWSRLSRGSLAACRVICWGAPVEPRRRCSDASKPIGASLAVYVSCSFCYSPTHVAGAFLYIRLYAAHQDLDRVKTVKFLIAMRWSSHIHFCWFFLYPFVCLLGFC